MKKLMTGLAAVGLALTAMAATPALAQYAHRNPNGDQHGIRQNDALMSSDRTYGAYAYAPASSYGMASDRQLMRRYPDSVFVNGQYRGADPDPAIRLQLRNSEPASAY